MIKGRGEYRLVWNEMMLSEPFKAVANAWSAGYLSINDVLKMLLSNTHLPSLHSTLPSFMSITPTYRTTLPSLRASSRKLSK